MKFKKIEDILSGIPYTSVEGGKVLYDHVISIRPKACLELGFAHGVASCYIAAALHENGGGHLTCVDLESSKERTPSIEDLVQNAHLTKYISVIREKNSYTWFLKNIIEERTHNHACEPLYDFCFIDGPKNWTIDGCAIFLVDKLLHEGGYILFDDYSWKYSEHGTIVTDGITHRNLSEDQLNAPNFKLVYDLLDMQHPNYSNFRIQDEMWAWAKEVKYQRKTLIINTRIFPVYRLKKFAKKLLRLK